VERCLWSSTKEPLSATAFSETTGSCFSAIVGRVVSKREQETALSQVPKV
jgi:hypothetical protein